jgi:hypothetical protein
MLLKLCCALRYLNSILACLFVCDEVCHLYGYCTNREREKETPCVFVLVAELKTLHIESRKGGGGGGCACTS